MNSSQFMLFYHKLCIFFTIIAIIPLVDITNYIYFMVDKKTNEWLKDNADRLSVEDLQDLESLLKNRGYSAILGFFLALFPQYSILTISNMGKYKNQSPKTKFYIGVLMFLPFFSSYVLSRPFHNNYVNYVHSLQEKYK